MALAFGELNGSAKKGGSYMKLENGVNTFRMIGGVLPRYLYWVTNSEKNQLPFECLGFDRSAEKFVNKEKDWVQATVKDDEGKPIKCGWAYAVQVINRKTGKLEILNLKKKFFEALVKYCKEIKADPTSQTEGFDIIVNREKTGTFAYNVEYTLEQIKMMNAGKSALSEADLELIVEVKPIEEVIPRPTSDEQKVSLDAFLSGSSEEKEDTSSNENKNEAINELDNM